MTSRTIPAPSVPTQAEIDNAIGRGSRLRSRAVLNAVAAIFGGHGDHGRNNVASTR